jgi:transposase-like protein
MNGAKEELNIPMLCPNHLDGCKSDKIKKNGHDISVKNRYQWLYCNSCHRQFYIHTSGWFIEFQEKLRETLIRLFEGGRYNVREIKAELKCSNSTASRILLMIVDAIHNSPRAKLCWSLPAFAKVLFADETFIKINKKKYWLVLVVNEDRRVLAFELVSDRKKDTLKRIIDRARKRLPGPIDVFVTDGLSQYTGVAQDFGHDLIHVRHIHKPPFGRVIISTIKHTPEKIITTNAATYTNILDSTNMFYARVTTMIKDKPQKEEKIEKNIGIKESKKKRKRGRPKGSKNRPKHVIEAEKKMKLDRKRKRGRPKNPESQNESKKKGARGRKNFFKTGEYMVYKYLMKEGKVAPLWNANPVVAEALEVCSRYFAGGCITTNYVEQQFSTLKKLIDFRGKRTLRAWKSILFAYFTIRDDPKILETIVEKIIPCPQVQNRWVQDKIYPHSFQKNISSEFLKAEIA